ncbi:MAG: hypothetical protein ABF990_12055 [Acetobacter sp.]|uniref:hypothetical protein n=1 Tax=Acetobacter sp. TaxID=440 RepID=UPI0039E8BB9B
MITRKEQVSALACAIFNQHDSIDDCIAIAIKYICEAERRAEQRVRAEIGQDSKRLDWLSEDKRGLAGHGSMGTYVTADGGNTYVNDDIRKAIDAAMREVE